MLYILIFECSWKYYYPSFVLSKFFEETQISFFISVLDVVYCLLLKRKKVVPTLIYKKAIILQNMTSYNLLQPYWILSLQIKNKQTSSITENHTSSTKHNWELTQFWNVKFKVLFTTPKPPTKVKFIFS